MSILKKGLTLSLTKSIIILKNDIIITKPMFWIYWCDDSIISLTSAYLWLNNGTQQSTFPLNFLNVNIILFSIILTDLSQTLTSLSTHLFFCFGWFVGLFVDFLFSLSFLSWCFEIFHLSKHFPFVMSVVCLFVSIHPLIFLCLHNYGLWETGQLASLSLTCFVLWTRMAFFTF